MMLLCEREAIVGAGLLIVNAAALEEPPPGVGFITTICALPAVAKSAALTVTCNCVELTNVVDRLLWFHWAMEVSTNPVPLIPSLIPVDPARMLLCEREAMVGAGLLIVNAAALEEPPPGVGFITMICAVPAVAKSAALTVTCNCVELTNAVGRLLWFQSTVELWTKPLPLIVTVIDETPAGALEGEIELIAGVGLFCGAGVWSVLAGAEPPPVQPHKAAVNSMERENVKRRRPAREGPLDIACHLLDCGPGDSGATRIANGAYY
jgi:hypothetical protein